MTLDGAALDRMMQRIGFLLRLSENNPNLNEATAAAEKAQELATQYNIELKRASQSVSEQDRTDAYDNHPFDLGSNHNWKRDLFYALCHINFSKGIVWSGTRRAAVIGEAHNLEIIKFLYTYLVREMTRLGNEAWLKETSNRLRNRSRLGEGEGTFKDRFGRGCTAMVNSRLYEQRDRMHRENNTSALMVVVDADLDRATQRFIPESRTMRQTNRRRGGVGSTAWQKGAEAGRNIPIHPAIN